MPFARVWVSEEIGKCIKVSGVVMYRKNQTPPRGERHTECACYYWRCQPASRVSVIELESNIPEQKNGETQLSSSNGT